MAPQHSIPPAGLMSHSSEEIARVLESIQKLAQPITAALGSDDLPFCSQLLFVDPGTVLKRCRIRRHDTTPIVVDLTVRYSTPVVLDDGSHAHRSGCVFLNPTREVMELIESFCRADG